MSATKPTWHGIVLVAGGAIGAGMFALPMVSAGPWMFWAIVGFLLVWSMTWLTASLLAKANLALVSEPDNGIEAISSFDSLVTTALSKRWAFLNNLCIMFIMMILMYAYTTSGAGIISYSLQLFGIEVADSVKPLLSLGFVSAIALVVWLGTSIVSQVTLLLMGTMTLMFCLATFGLLAGVEIELLDTSEFTLPYLSGALPVYVTAFACAGLVPTLVRHYSAKTSSIFQSLLWGTLIALLVYVFWLVVTLGNVGRDGFVNVIEAGGNINNLVEALVNRGADAGLQVRLTLFSHCAIITSFLSIALGLLHFMQDKLSLHDRLSMVGETQKKLIATLCCFVPPTLGSVFLPYGFVHAIGFAGMFVAFSFFILPGVMALSLRDKGLLRGVKGLALMAILFGAVILLLKLALMFSLLPKFP